MKQAKIITTILLASLLVIMQASVAFAAPALDESAVIAGAVTSVTLETDTHTGVTTVVVEIDRTQTVRISEQTAYELGLLDYDEDGNPFIVEPLPTSIEIDPATVIPDQEEPHHPVGSALATFFSDIDGLDYNTIMDAHLDGNGFGVIAQALWLTLKLEGDASVFDAILQAKEDGNYSLFFGEEETVPANWGQFRQAILSGDKKTNLGAIMSQNDQNNGNGNGNSNNSHGNNGNNHSNNGNRNGNGNGNGSGNGNGNGH